MTLQDHDSAKQYYVRCGAMGEIRRCRSRDGTRYHRGQRVLCHTNRGVLIGSILSPCAGDEPVQDSLIRALRTEDELLEQRLDKFRASAIARCREFIDHQHLTVQLLDVEHTFDGRHLWFHFAGEIPDALDSLTQSLAEEYEAIAKTEEFAKLLEEGCGPGCGTSAAKGCGTGGGCSTCAALGACNKTSAK